MIYTITRKYNSEELVQWYDIVYEQDYLDIVNIKHQEHIDNNEISYSNYIGTETVFNSLKQRLKSEDILMIDSEYLMETSKSPQESVSNSIKKLNELDCDKIIIMSKDKDVDETLNNGKCVILSPTTYSSYYGIILKQFNYYLINAGYSPLRSTIETINKTFRLNKRYKKFICLNGGVKPHRTFVYNFLKKQNILKDTFFSYMAYNVRDMVITPTNNEFNYKNQMLEQFGHEIVNHVNQDEYYKIFKDLPIILDCDFAGADFTQHPPIPHTSNSYFEISVSSVYMSDGVSIYTDEKTFRPFLTFTIPIFIGQPGLISLLKNYGFDLFEDIIDTSYDMDDSLHRIENALKNVKKLSEKSIDEIEQIYKSVEHRLYNNFNLLKEISRGHVKELIREISPKNDNE